MKGSGNGAAVNSILLRRSIRRWFPVFLLPMVAAFCIGFVWPFLQGLFLSFCNQQMVLGGLQQLCQSHSG